MPKPHAVKHALVLSTNRKAVDNLRGALATLGYSVRASRAIAAGLRRFRLTVPELLIIDAQLLEHRVPEDVVQRFHVWRRHGDHYHPHGHVESTATGAALHVSHGSGRVTLDPTDLTVHIGDRVAQLTQTEFVIFFLLLSHRGKAVTRDELLDAVKHEGAPYDRVVDRHICNIRHKIDVNPNVPSVIETVRGVGYRVEL